MQFTFAKIIEFYLCIQMLPVNVSWLHFSWTTLYIKMDTFMNSGCYFSYSIKMWSRKYIVYGCKILKVIW